MESLGRQDLGPTQRGHQFQHVQISDSARVQLGDTYNTYNISRENPLSLLPFATNAPFNSFDRQHEPTCLPDTRVDLLQEIYDWADGQDERCIFWLNGLAGTGKSTIARTVARRYFERERLGASFFFSRGSGDVSHAGNFFTSIAVQLANNVPSLQQYVYDAITKRKDVASQSLHDQWRQLVLYPLSKLDCNACQCSYVLIVDALDECDDDNNVRIILQLLAEARSLKTVRLRVFLTSRPEIPIRHGMYRIPQPEHQDFVLQNVPPAIINHDISLFLEYNLGIIGQEWTLGAGWPGEQALRQLVLNASGLFIWAATACRFIREGKRFALGRLDTILKGSSSAVIAPEKHLDEIYIAVLKHSISSDYTDEEKEKLCGMQKRTLGSVVVLLSPLSAFSLSRLLHLPKKDVDQTLEDLYAILDIPEDQTRPLRLHHPSFRDFLLNEDRCGDSSFWVDEKQAHQTLAAGCIQLMSNSLKQDICCLEAPGVLVTNIESSQLEKCLPAELQYACLYWVQHLKRSGAQLYDQVFQFLQDHLLHWLEALSWIGKTSEGILAIISLESIALTSDCPQFCEFIQDVKRFAQYSRPVIEQAPLQVYLSALVFAPARSKVRNEFQARALRWMKRLPNTRHDWSALLQTLEGHTGPVRAIAFSKDGKTLASASHDGTVRLWDPTTGQCRQTLEGHTDLVRAIAFSEDGKTLASASHDGTVRLWDLTTGQCRQTLKGHTDWVRAIAFSKDGKTLASASRDGTVRLWDPTTGQCRQTLEGHTDLVRAIAFSEDGKTLASASRDRTVRLWDLTTGQCRQTLEGHTDWVRAIAFSKDGKTLASASGDHTVRLWDLTTGQYRQTLEGHTDWVHAIAFSKDGKTLASASSDRTVRLWDLTTGQYRQTLEGHTDWVRAIVFSKDGKTLASASDDRTVRLWDLTTGQYRQTLEGHTDWVYAIAFSKDGKTLASASSDRTVRLWDLATGRCRQTLEGYTNSVNAIAFSKDGKTLASASSDHTVRLWDPTTGQCRQTLEGHINSVNAIAFSKDGKTLASASDDRTVRLWDPTTGQYRQTLEGHTNSVNAIVFSKDGKTLASASHDGTVRLWDLTTGQCRQTLEGIPTVTGLSFSKDGCYLNTDRGIQILNSSALGSHHNLEQPTHVMFVNETWVTQGTQNLLWLPPEYRDPSSSAVHDNILALGCRSGQVIVFEFAFP